MPKVKTQEVPFAKIARLIRGYASVTDVAECLGVCYATAKARQDKPETLTLGELRDISRRLHIPKQEIMEAITW